MANMANFPRTLVCTTIAASLALDAVSAQANTRAGDQAVLYDTPVSQPGEGRDGKGESVASGFSQFLAGLFAGLWTAGILTVAIDDDDDKRQSPGT